MSVHLDHLLWASPDLDVGSTTLGDLFGVSPIRGGSHPGFGTRNSLLSLGESYLEIIAPDPEQSRDANRGGEISALRYPRLITFAVRTDDIVGYKEAADRANIATRGPIEMGRTRPDGVRLDWSCLYITDPTFGESIPFAIDWKQSAHPSRCAPTGAILKSLVVLHPQAERLSDIYQQMEIDVPVRLAPRPGFQAVFGTPRGDVVLS